jgi:hypothetical protein
MTQTLPCHGPQERATQVIVRLSARADARLWGGPVKPGHDNYFWIIRNA